MNSNQKSIDLNHLNSITSGDESFKKELIAIFLNQIPVFISNMKKYLGQNISWRTWRAKLIQQNHRQ
jgi:hypothetical protein